MITVRFLRILPFFLLGSAFLILDPSTGLTQPGRDRGSSRGPGGFDPSMFFNMYSGGKDYIVVSEMIARATQRDPSAKERIEGFLQRQGITNGQITRDQFNVYMQERMAQFGGMRGGPPSGPGGPPSGPGGPPFSPGGPPASPGGPPQGPGNDAAREAEREEERARDSFRRRDRNNDGVLSTDEVSDELRAEISRWDTNQNGVITFDEYKEYYRARTNYMRSDNRDSRDNRPDEGYYPPQQTEEEDKKPPVYRFGQMPKEIPSWFSGMDRDRDGQVALYEWRDGGQPMDKFREIDINRDGFATVDEMLRSVKQQDSSRKQKAQEYPQVVSLSRTEESSPSFGGMDGGNNLGGSSKGQRPSPGGLPDRGSFGSRPSSSGSKDRSTPGGSSRFGPGGPGSFGPGGPGSFGPGSFGPGGPGGSDRSRRGPPSR